MTLQVQFDFVLPKGYVDEQGTVHRSGTMRMATAMDEITPLRDPRVRSNEAYLVIVLLAQVITRLGTLPRVTPDIVERFFAADIAYLQNLYREINDVEPQLLQVVCPNCGHVHEVEIPLLGES
ncbi:MAG: phage tail assembly protein [Anaerolineae bacterium]|nr:phage tail assembly protein [Anaerolineae bacterium]